MEHPDGLFTWADVAVSDAAAGKAFYGAVFGWSFDDAPDGTYTMVTKDGEVVAGLGQVSDDQPKMWQSYVNVSDVDRVVARAKELGGRVLLEPMDIFDAGRMGVVADPTGAVIAFWQPGEHQGADVFDEPGCLTWNELITVDIDAAVRFYGELLPWEILRGDTDGFTYHLIKADGRENGGMYAGPPDALSHWIVYFRVDDADTAVKRITKAGGAVLRDPVDSPYGRMAIAQDPQGAVFSVIGPEPQGA